MINKSAIIYCRQSRIGLSSPDMNSTDSQEYENKKFMTENNLKLYKVVKDFNSAFIGKQSELKNILRLTKRKTIIVWEASRLSRNLSNFRDIYNICKKNEHDIAIVNMKNIFKTDTSSNYELLYKLIERAQQESIDTGRRISRAFRLKKELETEYGFRREGENVIEDEREMKIIKLIHMLGKKGSYIEDIKRNIYQICKCEEEFELIEYDNNGYTKISSRQLPYAMSTKNIVETLNTYSIKMRKRNWYTKDIKKIIDNKKLISLNQDEDIADSVKDMKLRDDDSNKIDIDYKWITILFDPKIGLPPNIQVPEGFELPKNKTLLYLPK